MSIVTLPQNIVQMLDIVPGENAQGKIVNLLTENAISKLKDCDAKILEFEAKYVMSFEEFKQAWKADKIASKHSYGVERDYMEWEGFKAERKRWLAILKEFKAFLSKGEGEFSH